MTKRPGFRVISIAVRVTSGRRNVERPRELAGRAAAGATDKPDQEEYETSKMMSSVVLAGPAPGPLHVIGYYYRI